MPGEHLGGLYIHIPFCIRKCGYCGFYSQVARHGDARLATYAAHIEALVGRLASSGLLEGVRTVYIGGGTPTMAGPHLVRLVDALARACPAVREFSVEANPESLAPALARDLARAGATRVSLGVQSLCDDELRALGRAHSSAQARSAAQSVVAAGLELSCDLMCGIPLQTPASWSRSLDGVLSLGAGHVSCYPLSIEEGTPFDGEVLSGRMGVPDADLQADMMTAARDVLEGHGLARYEVASYALSGLECRHNIAYWTGGTYLGLGPGAASMLGATLYGSVADALGLQPLDGVAQGARIRFSMNEDVASFERAVGAHSAIETCIEVLDARQAAAEDLMLAMRMVEGISQERLAQLCARGLPSRAARAALERASELGLVRLDGASGSWRPTQNGWLLGNTLFGLMWDTAQG